MILALPRHRRVILENAPRTPKQFLLGKDFQVPRVLTKGKGSSETAIPPGAPKASEMEAMMHMPTGNTLISAFAVILEAARTFQMPKPLFQWSGRRVRGYPVLQMKRF